MYRVFVRINLAVFEPADHPFIDDFSRFERHAVGAQPDEKAHLVYSAVKTVAGAGLLIHKLCAVGSEEVTLRREDDPRRGRRQFPEISRVQPSRKKYGKAQLGVEFSFW